LSSNWKLQLYLDSEATSHLTDRLHFKENNDDKTLLTLIKRENSHC